ncbi:hypothetical protein KILIM_060_00010, partial [Kineosphaera limosa NBRC 100340]
MDNLRVLVVGVGAQMLAMLRAHPRVAAARECLDIVDVRALSLGLGADAAVFGCLDLDGLDRSTVRELIGAGVEPIGLVSSDAAEVVDEVVATQTSPDAAQRAADRWRRLGVRYVLRAEPRTGLAAELDRVLRAVGGEEPADLPAPRPPDRAGPPVGWREVPASILDALVGRDLAALRRESLWPALAEAARGPDRPGTAGSGTVLAVWGPAGAPGRSVVAAVIARRLSAWGATVLLVDADTYGGAQAVLHGQLDEAPGLIRAVRLADRGRLDDAALADCAVAIPGGPALLTGLTDAAGWPRLRPAGLEVVIEVARRRAHVTVVDCGFCLEEDEELSYDTAAPARNGATLAALRSADHVLALGVAEPVA